MVTPAGQSCSRLCTDPLPAGKIGGEVCTQAKVRMKRRYIWVIPRQISKKKYEMPKEYALLWCLPGISIFLLLLPRTGTGAPDGDTWAAKCSRWGRKRDKCPVLNQHCSSFSIISQLSSATSSVLICDFLLLSTFASVLALTLDMDKLGEIRRYHSKERLNISSFSKFERRGGGGYSGFYNTEDRMGVKIKTPKNP